MHVDRLPTQPLAVPPAVLAGVDPASHKRHALHGADRIWPETNCYVDLLIEVLAACGFEPRAAFGFTITQDWEGDHFTFFKIPAADLLRLYGIEVIELPVFDDLERHLALQVERGRLPLVEVDAYHLPDTRGINYRLAHGKTTIGVNAIDVAAGRLDYFHNAGLFRLEGADYEALLRGYRPGALPLFPYSEILKFGRGAPASDLLGTARVLLATHLARRPGRNPFEGWRSALPQHTAALAVRSEAWFHTYAFNVLRQAGANFDCLAAHLEWMAEAGEAGLVSALDDATAIAEGAKVLQFKLARAAARQRVAAVDSDVERLAMLYDDLVGRLTLQFCTA